VDCVGSDCKTAEKQAKEQRREQVREMDGWKLHASRLVDSLPYLSPWAGSEVRPNAPVAYAVLPAAAQCLCTGLE